METKYLYYFLEVCKQKSLTKASRSLYITQQALSTIIRKLEVELGVSLFKRTKSGMVLTEYGEYLKTQAVKITELVNDTENKIEVLKKGYQVVLNIGVAFGVMSAMPSQLLSGFYRRFPNIALHITEYPDIFCEQAVLDEKENIGFSIAPIDSTKFETDTVIQDKMCILVNKENSLYHKQSVKFSDLQNQPILILNNNFKLRRIFNENCSKIGFKPHIVLETMELILIHNFCIHNKGIGVGVDFIARDMENVKPINFDPECLWKVNMIRKKGKTLTQAEEQFIKYIQSFECYYPAKDLKINC